MIEKQSKKRRLYIQQDEEMEMLKTKAIEGDDDSQIVLSFHYAFGMKVIINIMESKEWCIKSSEKGNNLALGMIKLNGWNEKQDNQMAINYFEKAIKEDINCKRKDTSFAIFMMAFIYFNGIEMEQNYEKAFELFQKSSQLGNSNAMNNIACMYEHGKGVDQNFELAYQYYTKVTILLFFIFFLNNFLKSSLAVWEIATR